MRLPAVFSPAIVCLRPSSNRDASCLHPQPGFDQLNSMATSRMYQAAAAAAAAGFLPAGVHHGTDGGGGGGGGGGGQFAGFDLRGMEHTAATGRSPYSAVAFYIWTRAFPSFNANPNDLPSRHHSNDITSHKTAAN